MANDPPVDPMKKAIGSVMKDLGFKVNYQKQEKIAEAECCIYYTTVDLEVYSTASYIAHASISIVWVETQDVRLPVRLAKIVGTVEGRIIRSGLGNCTTFKFGAPSIIDLGTSYRAELPCLLMEEVERT